MARPIAWNCECGEPNSGRQGQPLRCKKCGKPWGSQVNPESSSSGSGESPKLLHEIVVAQVAELDQTASAGADFAMTKERIKRWKKRTVAALRSYGLDSEAEEFDRLEPRSFQSGNPEGNLARRVQLYRTHLLALAEELEQHPAQHPTSERSPTGSRPPLVPSLPGSGPPIQEQRVEGGARRDFFICHATEDKTEIARPIADELLAAGRTVWFDEFELVVGDSLRRKIDEGLTVSEAGVVILSSHFFSKEWPRRELDGLVALEKRVLPIWHRVTHEEVARFSPTLAGVYALKSAVGPARIAAELIRALARAGPR